MNFGNTDSGQMRQPQTSMYGMSGQNPAPAAPQQNAGQTQELNLRPQESLQEIENPQTLEQARRASLAGMLSDNLGIFVVCEFLIGTAIIVRRDGILYSVGNNFLTLYQEEDDRYIVCDLFSLKFITFYNSTTRPSNVPFVRDGETNTFPTFPTTGSNTPQNQSSSGQGSSNPNSMNQNPMRYGGNMNSRR